MLAASVNNEQNQQMLVGTMQVVRNELAPFAAEESMLAAAIAQDLLTGTVQLTLVISPCTSKAVLLCKPSQRAIHSLEPCARWFIIWFCQPTNVLVAVRQAP